MQLANLADQVKSVAVWHRDIAYYDVGVLLAEGRQRLSRRTGASRPCGGSLERHGQRFQEVCIVLYQQAHPISPGPAAHSASHAYRPFRPHVEARAQAAALP